MRRVIALLLIAVFGGVLFTGIASAKKRKGRRIVKRAMEFQETLSIIESGSYIFTPREEQTPGRERRRMDIETFDYRFITNSSYIESYYPSKVKGEAKDKSVVVDKEKMNIVVTSSSNSTIGHDKYTFILTILYDGSATLNIHSRSRAPINYYGEVSPIEKRKQ